MKNFLRWRLGFVVWATAVLAALAAADLACGSSEDLTTATGSDAGSNVRDSGLVDPLDGSSGGGDAGSPPPPTCTKYCDLVQKNCTDEHAQYGSVEECMAFCAHVPLGDSLEQKAPSLACRQYFAGSPALTDPSAYCLAAGPFGGGLCGDRCTTLCQVSLSACSSDAGTATPYASLADCKTACADFAFRDAGTDGGGERLDGPESGDTLNCRLFHLRKSVMDPESCASLGADAGACR